MAEYSKSAILKYTRLAKNMTQEELSESICEPATLSRYENGKLDPTDGKFMQLMQKMGESGELYTFPIKCEEVDLQEKMKELLNAIYRKEWDAAKQIMEKIKNEHHMSMEYPENRQYVGRVEIIVNLRKDVISRKKAIEELEKLLKLTMEDYDKILKAEFKRISDTEMMILYNIATIYDEDGEVEKAEFIFRGLRDFFQQENVICEGRPRYLFNTNYSDMLGMSGRYDESIAVCKEEIAWLKRHNKTNCLFNLYFNIGWNIKKKIEEGLEPEESMEQAKCYVWLAYQLAKNYPECNRYSKSILKFYEDMNC